MNTSLQSYTIDFQVSHQTAVPTKTLELDPALHPCGPQPGGRKNDEGFTFFDSFPICTRESTELCQTALSMTCHALLTAADGLKGLTRRG